MLDAGSGNKKTPAPKGTSAIYTRGATLVRSVTTCVPLISLCQTRLMMLNDALRPDNGGVSDPTYLTLRSADGSRTHSASALVPTSHLSPALLNPALTHTTSVHSL